MKQVLINTSSFGKSYPEIEELESTHRIQVNFNPYGRRLKKEELLELVNENTVGVVAGLEPYDQDVIDQSSGNMKAISRCGIGADNLASLNKEGLFIYTTPDAPTQAVAELAVSQMLSILKRLISQHNHLAQGQWQREMGSLLSGKKVGLIGFGRIGQRVAKILSAFDANVSYYDLQEIENAHASFEPNLDTLTSESDILSLHLPVTDLTQNLVNSGFLKKLKSNAILINTARGGLVNEADLASFLSKNEEAYAALDVFQNEPYSGPLTSLPNILLTPHVGSFAKEARMAMEQQALQNLIIGLKESGVIDDK